LVVALLTISVAATAQNFNAAIENGQGTLEFGDPAGPILAGIVSFDDLSFGATNSGLLEVHVEAIPAPDLGSGRPYTQFVSIDVLNPGGVTFSDAVLTMMVDPSIAGLVDLGTNGTMYYNDGSGWTPHPIPAVVTDIGAGYKVMQVGGLDHFSDWGGWGDDPLIPDPSVASIIGCGLLLLCKRLKG